VLSTELGTNDNVIVVGIAHVRIWSSHVQLAGFIEQSCEECQHHPRKAIICWTHQAICVGRVLQLTVIRAFSRRGNWPRLFSPHQKDNGATNGGIVPIN
jgi:hypothetical protein